MEPASNARRSARAWKVTGTILVVAMLPFSAFGLWLLYRGLSDGPSGDPAMAWFLGTVGTVPGLLAGMGASGSLYAASLPGDGSPGSPARAVGRIFLCCLPTLVPAAVLVALGVALG